MADHKIGKVYVELDLDKSRYMRSQQTLVKEAASGAKILETNFHRLGIKSNATFDLMRAQAVKSFEAIKKSGKATTDDIIRAEKAKAEKIKRINEQQYGHTISMFERIKKHWLAVSATIIATFYAINRAIHKSLDAYAIFDKGLIGIQKTTNMTDKQMVAMGASIRDLASYVPVATEGLLEIAEAAGQLGVTGVKNVTLFTETLAKMQIASDVVGAEGAKALARLLVTASESADQIKTLGSVIVSLGNQMEASELEIVEMASEISRATTAFNVSSASAVAYGAALKSMGAKAEGAGTAIGRTMIDIEKAIIKGGEKFLYLQQVTGMTGETIKRVFQEDSAKVFNAFIRGAHRMTKSGESAITILGKFGLTSIRVVKNLTPLIKNVGQLNEAFEIANKEVKNATALDIEAMRASQSFSAQMQMTKNVIDEIASGIGKGLAPAIIEVTKDFRDWVDQNQEFIGQDIPDRIKKVADAMKDMGTSLVGVLNTFNSIPKDIVAIGGAGIIGRMLFGTQAGVTLAAIVAIQKLKVDRKPYDESDWATKKGVEFLAWLNDADLNVRKLTGSFVELHTAQGSIWIHRDDIEVYLNSLNEIDRATDSVTNNTKSLGDSFAAMRLAADEANKELKKYYKELDKHKAAIDKVTLAALPEYERALESIRRKYDELNKALDEHGALAGKTTEEIAELHKDFSERMMDDVGGFAESFAKDIRGTVEETEKATKEIDELWTNAMDRVQSTMADTFMNAMQGKLNSFKDIFKSFCDILLRYWAEMLAQMVMQSRVLQGITSGLGGLFGGTGTSAGISGISPMSWASVGTGMKNFWDIGKQIGAGIYSALGFGGGAPTAATWSSVGGFPTATIGGEASSGLGGLGGLGTWIKIGGQLYLAYSAFTSFTSGDYAAGGVHAAALGASMTGPWGMIAGALMEVGLFVKKLFFGSNKKRSYYGKEYTYGDYSLDEGWGEPTGEIYKDKRKGEKAFGESGESMAQSGLELMNMLDSTFKKLLGIFGEDWADRFTTAMGKLSIEQPSFDFYISAEDKGEFKEDWKKSWQAMTESLIEPIIAIGSDLLKEALDGVITDSSVWNYFTDDFKEYLQDSLEGSLADLQIDWSEVTDEESLTSALEQMGMAAENIAAIIEHFETIEKIFADISEAIEFRDLSEAARSATSRLRDINAQFDQFALTLEALGVDLEKYTDLEIAHLIALQEAGKAMSDSAISGEDLAIALQHMADSMAEAGHSAEEIAGAIGAVRTGILDSIEDIKQQHEDYGKTAMDQLIEKHPEWEGIDFEQWLQMSKNPEDLTEFSTEMLQEWRNLGELLQAQWEEQQAALEDSLTDIADSIEQANQTEIAELKKLVNAFIKASDAIIDYQESLLAGPGGMLPPDVQYAQASQQLDAAIQDLYSEDRETALAASQAISGYVSQFLEASKTFSATPEQYMADFARAMVILNTAAEISANWASKILSQIASYGFSDEGGGDYGGSTPSYDPSLQWGDPGYYYPMQQGGIISGPETGYQAPITFHGTEHIVSGNQMGDVKEILGEVKEVLIQVRDTNGDQNKTNKKLYRIIDRVSQGEEYLMTKAV